jgi:excisionase family DNA binding protein
MSSSILKPGPWGALPGVASSPVLTGTMHRGPVNLSGLMHVVSITALPVGIGVPVAPVKAAKKPGQARPARLARAEQQAELTPPGLGLIEGVEARIGPWTVKELARHLRQSPGSIYNAIKAGKLPAIKTTGSIYRICPQDAGKWLRDRKTVPAGEPQAPKHRQAKHKQKKRR